MKTIERTIQAAEVADLVGAEHVTRGEESPVRVNGRAPALVVRPGTKEEATAVLLRARERGWAVVPCGGGTQIDQGFPPRALDLLLATGRLDRVVDYQPDDMTVTVEPGLTLARLAELLAGRNQFLPLNPPRPERATVGGMVAAAETGPWFAGYGSPRDWLIGCRVVGADGREVRGGGQVVKNVAGFDLPKLYTGSFGTLGLITELTFKVLPHPGSSAACRAWFSCVEAAEAFLGQVMHSDLLPAAVELVPAATWEGMGRPAGDGDPWSVFFHFLHVPDALAWQVAKVAELAETVGGGTERLDPETGEALLAALRDEPARHPLAVRLGVPFARTTAAATAVEKLGRQYGAPLRIQARAATGQVYVYAGEDAPATLVEDLRGVARAEGGVAVVRQAPAVLADGIDPWGEPGPELRLHRGLKQTLDPTGVFSPGRFVGRL